MKKSYAVALGGVFAALAVVIMTLGGMIPVATYISPVLCMLLLQFVNAACGSRIGWTWYAAVGILSLLLSPDKEAAAVFAAIGYYPLVKRRFDKLPVKWLIKAVFFNCTTVVLYWLLLRVIGMEQILEDFAEVGLWGCAIALVLGNVCFFLIDRVLNMIGVASKK